MKSMELTDLDGDALTIIIRGDSTWITCTSGPEEVTVGPFPLTHFHQTFGTTTDPPGASAGLRASAAGTWDR